MLAIGPGVSSTWKILVSVFVEYSLDDDGMITWQQRMSVEVLFMLSQYDTWLFSSQLYKY